MRLEVLPPERKQGAPQAHPLRRWATPLDSASEVRYVATETASFDTGAELMSDGGATAQ